MKKLLIGTSALVAAGLVAGAAHAADPIKLNVGGFAGSWVVYGSNDDAYLATTATPEETAVDVKGDAEVIFTGSTTLDNGLKVSFSTQIEAGGRQQAAPSTWADEYNLSVAGSFGTVVMGATNNALAAIAVTSPRVGGRLYGGAFNEGDNVVGVNILAPNGYNGITAVGGASGDGISAPNASFVNTNGDAESISYISPAFAGFTVGATYVPHAAGGESNPNAPVGANTLDAYGVGAAYSGEFGGVGVRVAGGWLTGDAPAPVDEWNEYQFGANVSYAGFTFGGGAKVMDVTLNTPADAGRDRLTWDLGASYKTGPYGVSLAYFDSTAENAVGVSDDHVKVWELNGEYAMGPGVALVGGLAHVDYEDGSTVAARAATPNAFENSGFVASTGITLSF